MGNQYNQMNGMMPISISNQQLLSTAESANWASAKIMQERQKHMRTQYDIMREKHLFDKKRTFLR
jgi:hypothetical protein